MKLIALIFILFSVSLDARDLEELYLISKSTEKTKSRHRKLEIYGITGPYNVNLTVMDFKENQSFKIPEYVVDTKIIKENFYVIVQTMPDESKFRWIIEYDDEKQIYKKWEITPDLKVNLYLGILNDDGKVISYMSVIRHMPGQEIMSETHSGNKKTIEIVNYEKNEIRRKFKLIAEPKN